MNCPEFENYFFNLLFFVMYLVHLIHTYRVTTVVKEDRDMASVNLKWYICKLWIYFQFCCCLVIVFCGVFLGGEVELLTLIGCIYIEFLGMAVQYVFKLYPAGSQLRIGNQMVEYRRLNRYADTYISPFYFF